MTGSIGEKICQYRQMRKMTQEEFASRLGVTPQAVSKWERGNGLPDVSLLYGICEVLELSADTLIGIKKYVAENGNSGAEAEIMNNIIAEPILLEFGKELIPAVGEGLKQDIVNGQRLDLARRKGYLLPILRLRDNLALNDYEWQIVVYGKVWMKGFFEAAEEEVFHKMINGVVKICEENYDQILNKQLVKILIDNVKKQYPGIVDDLVPEKISYLHVMRVLQDKVRSQGNIKDLIHILEEMEADI